jgi:CRISPR/Cas system-associated protein Csm6
MRLANHAKSLRDDDLLKFIFDKLERNETEAMLTKTSRDERDEHFWAVQGLRKIKEALRIIFDDGKAASVELNDYLKQKENAERRRA